MRARWIVETAARRRTCALSAAKLLASVFLVAAVMLASLFSGHAHANGLSVGMRIQQEFYKPLVPVSRNFKTCFRPGPDGRMILGLCSGTEDTTGAGSDVNRLPAQQTPATQRTQPPSRPGN